MLFQIFMVKQFISTYQPVKIAITYVHPSTTTQWALKDSSSDLSNIFCLLVYSPHFQSRLLSKVTMNTADHAVGYRKWGIATRLNTKGSFQDWCSLTMQLV
jgi:hypothetical protein